jgi:hypothetical protein
MISGQNGEIGAANTSPANLVAAEIARLYHSRRYTVSQRYDEELAVPMNELRDELMKQPIVELIGLVDASGAGGGRSHPETTWTLSFTCDAYRVVGSPMRKMKLTVRREVSQAELDELMAHCFKERIIRFRARLQEGVSPDSADAWLEEFVGKEEDVELAEYRDQLNAPVILEDPRFGELYWDRQFHWFVGETEWNGRTIEFTLRSASESPDDCDEALRTAHTLWSDETGWAKRINDYAVAELLELKNDNWLGEDESPLSPEEFVGRMSLQSIACDGEDEFTFWHDDGDLFWGHSIQICGNLRQGPTSADIPG